MLSQGLKVVSLSNKREYEFNHDYRSVPDQYPSCVDIVDIWPPPNSVLRPIHEHATFADYVMKITFSRPVVFGKIDKSYVTLSISTINLLGFHPLYSRYLYGSERTLLVYFRVANSMKFIQ